MNKFINNVIELGFSGVLLWALVLIILHWFVNSGFKGFEKMMGWKHTIYPYDILWVSVIAALFLYGIYSYR